MALRAYLVEDNPTIRENLIDTLEELAEVKTVGEAENEAEGAQWLTRNTDRWDLAIVDLFLKKGSGLGVVQALRKRSPKQAVIVLSNYATQEMRKRCLALGVDAVFDKSNQIDALVDFCRARGKRQGTHLSIV